MKILITGSNGLLGQKLLHKLREDDSVELVATSIGVNRVSQKKGYKYISLDVTNKKEVEKVILAQNYIENNLLDSSIFDGRLLVGVAGTFTSLASIFLEQDKFNEDEINLTDLKKEDVFAINKKLLHLNESQIITKYKGIDPKRAKTIQAGILLAKEIISKYNVNSIKVSNSDILEGLILKKY